MGKAEGDPRERLKTHIHTLTHSHTTPLHLLLILLRNFLCFLERQDSVLTRNLSLSPEVNAGQSGALVKIGGLSFPPAQRA